jgi:hypothetical protein
MQSRPLDDETDDARGKIPGQECGPVDSEGSLVVSVASVEMRRRMVAEKHRDDDPEESADLRH